MSPQLLSEQERELVAAAWPVHLFEDPQRQPRIVSSEVEFAHELLLGDHLEDVVVLPGGLEATGLAEEAALPEWLLKALEGAPSVLDFLRGIDGEALSAHKAALEYVDERGVQREALPRPYPFCLWDALATGSTNTGAATIATGALPEAWRDLRQRLAAVEGLVAKGEVDGTRIYACEMRRLRERDLHSSLVGQQWQQRERTKSLSLRHARDWLGEEARWSLYWNCYDDGLFVGGNGSGKGLHVDQVLWSNVGKHWRGYKLLAIWPAGEVSARMVAELGDAHFRPPLGPGQRAALEEAAKIVLLRPGDIFLCSGGVAHTTLCISEELTVTAYESFVTLNPRHVSHFLRTGDTCGPGALDRGVMEAEELLELRRSVVRRVAALLDSELREDPCVNTFVAADPLGEKQADGRIRAQLRGYLVWVALTLAEDMRFAVHAPGGPEQLLSAAHALSKMPGVVVPGPAHLAASSPRPSKRQRCGTGEEEGSAEEKIQGCAPQPPGFDCGDSSSTSASSSSSSSAPSLSEHRCDDTGQ